MASRYEGEMMQGWFHGHGVFWRADGTKYEGEFRGGRIWGLGKKLTYLKERHSRIWKKMRGYLTQQQCREGTLRWWQVPWFENEAWTVYSMDANQTSKTVGILLKLFEVRTAANLNNLGLGLFPPCYYWQQLSCLECLRQPMVFCLLIY